MRGPRRTAWRAYRAAARTTALAAMLAASGLAAGAASASGAQDTAASGASLIYECGFPSGPRQVQVTVSAVLPAAAKTGKPIQPASVSLTMALPPAAASGLASLHSAAVSAATRLTISASEGPGGTSVVWPGVTKRPVPRPAHGGLTLTTMGTVPPVTASSAGEVILTAADLSVTFTAGQAALAPGPARSAAPAASGAATAPAPESPAAATAPAPESTAQAPLLVNCTLAPGQHAALGGLVVTGEARRDAHRNAADPTGKCPKLPKGGLKLNPRFPPPPHPPLTLVGHSPSQGCAFTTGYANIRKLKGAALIAPALTNVDQALTALANTTNKINYLQLQNAAQLDFHGLRQFPPSTATFLTFGFVPTTATIELIEHGTINIFVVGPANPFIHCEPNRFRTCDSVATVYSRLSARVAPGSVKVNGVPLNVGSHCETTPFDAVVTGTSASKPPYSIQFGGPLTGMVTIPPFKNCGVGENLDPIFNAAISGPQNFNLLTQGELCSVIGAFGCDKNRLPVPPQPLHEVTG
jgi:hypothetical protein